MLTPDRAVEPQQFQRTPATRAFLVGGAGLGIAVFGWLYAGILARPDIAGTEALAIGGFIAPFVGLALWFATMTARVLVVDGEGVAVRGLFRSRQWTWDEVDTVDAAADTSMTVTPFLVLKNGRRVWLRCANGYAVARVPAHVQVAVDCMRQQLHAHRSSGART